MATSKLTDKSEFEIEAADILLKKSCYAPIAHCSYYACIQLLKHIWLYPMHKTENDLSNRPVSNQKAGSNDYLINQVEQYISNVKHGDNKEIREFRNNILQLKSLRVDADYKDVDFVSNDADKSINLSKGIVYFLKKYI
jgi:hypothetical protein